MAPYLLPVAFVVSDERVLVQVYRWGKVAPDLLRLGTAPCGVLERERVPTLVQSAVFWAGKVGQYDAAGEALQVRC